MYQPTGFKDYKNIIIINKIPYFRYTGSTYKDKLKNGLSLDYVFQLEDMIPIIDEEFNVEIEENISIQKLEAINYEENYDFYEQKEFEAMSFTRKRKGKWIPLKKRQARNTKKKNIKSNGYDDKLFAIEQNLPNLFHKSQIEIDYENISVISNESRYLDYYNNHDNYYDYDDYSDNYSNNYYEYDDYSDNWSYN